MQSNNIIDASIYFNANWKTYLDAVNNNTLYHREMFYALNQFLNDNFATRPFSMVDVGCGDSSMIVPILKNRPMEKYIGIDAANEVLKISENNLLEMHCEKQWICADMLAAIRGLTAPFDIIFTSYALHHLSSQEKFGFIQHCKNVLNPNGFLLMVDGVLKENQTRDEWLEALKNRMQETHPEVAADIIEQRMCDHPRKDDFPESISTFLEFSKKQKWKNFECLVEKDIFAFMVFAK